MIDWHVNQDMGRSAVVEPGACETAPPLSGRGRQERLQQRGSCLPGTGAGHCTTSGGEQGRAVRVQVGGGPTGVEIAAGGPPPPPPPRSPSPASLPPPDSAACPAALAGATRARAHPFLEDASVPQPACWCGGLQRCTTSLTTTCCPASRTSGWGPLPQKPCDTLSVPQSNLHDKGPPWIKLLSAVGSAGQRF